MRIDDITNKQGRLYVRVWINALSVFLGWPRTKTLRWAEKWADSLNDEHDLLFHETPIKWIANLLIPQSIRDQLPGDQLVYVHQIICAAVHREDSLSDVRPHFNWKLAKVRVDAAMRDIVKQSNKPGVKMEKILLNYRNGLFSTKPMPASVRKLFEQTKRVK